MTDLHPEARERLAKAYIEAGDTFAAECVQMGFVDGKGHTVALSAALHERDAARAQLAEALLNRAASSITGLLGDPT